MDSMPPATTISDSPSCTACAASATAFNPEPQTLLIVIAATRASHPPLSAAWRAGFWPRPACTTLPRIASSICLAPIPARRAASATTLPPSSGAENPARPPWNFPTGVRTADKITGISIHASGRVTHYYSGLRNSLPRRFVGNPKRLLLVRGWPVKSGNRHAKLTKIHRKLRAMMNQVFETRNAQHFVARHRKNQSAFPRQRPDLLHLRIRYARQRRACLSAHCIERWQKVSMLFDARKLRTFDFHVGRRNGGRREMRKRGYVTREPSERARFLMRFPIPLVGGNAFQRFACVSNFNIKFGKKHFGDGHHILQQVGLPRR